MSSNRRERQPLDEQPALDEQTSALIAAARDSYAPPPATPAERAALRSAIETRAAKRRVSAMALASALAGVAALVLVGWLVLRDREGLDSAVAPVAASSRQPAAAPSPGARADTGGGPVATDRRATAVVEAEGWSEAVLLTSSDSADVDPSEEQGEPLPAEYAVLSEVLFGVDEL